MSANYTLNYNGEIYHITPVEKPMADAMLSTELCLKFGINTPYVMVMNKAFLPLKGEAIDKIDGLSSFTYKAETKPEEVDETVRVTWTPGEDNCIVTVGDKGTQCCVEYVGYNAGNLGVNLEFYCEYLEDINVESYELFTKTTVTIPKTA